MKTIIGQCLACAAPVYGDDACRVISRMTDDGLRPMSVIHVRCPRVDHVSHRTMSWWRRALAFVGIGTVAACGGDPFVTEFNATLDAAIEIDAGFAWGPDAAADAAPGDERAREPDAIAPDAGSGDAAPPLDASAPDAIADVVTPDVRDTGPVCTPLQAAQYDCTQHNNTLRTNVPDQFCILTNNGNVQTNATPAACRACLETYTCACVLAGWPNLCNAPTCEEWPGKVVVTCH